MTVRRRHRPGFTMIELTVSLIVSSMLVVAIGSSIVIASHAIPDGSETTRVTVNAGKSLDRFVVELRYATAIVEHAATAVEFYMGDRNGDFNEEVVRYEWSGTAGAPITRQYNGGEIVVFIPDVQSLNMTYVTTAYQQLTAPVESAEIELSRQNEVVADKKPHRVTSDNWIGQYIVQPTLVAGADSWNVTRVQFKAKAIDATAGMTEIQLRAADVSRLPTTQIHAAVSVLESDLMSTYAWHEVIFPGARGFDLGEGLCLVFEWKNDTNSAGIQWNTNTGSDRLSTTDGGNTWTRSVTSTVTHAVYGTYTSPGPIVMAYALERVDIKLVSGAEQDVVLYASAHTVNQPEVSMP